MNTEKQVGQHPRMVGQHDPEWWVNMVRNLHANQMQVNGFADPEYRTREQFLDFLLQKKIESNERKLKKATQELENFKTGILKKQKNSQDEITIEKLKQLNKEQEEKINKL